MENGIVIYLKMSVETQIERIESLEEKSLKKKFAEHGVKIVNIQKSKF